MRGFLEELLAQATASSAAAGPNGGRPGHGVVRCEFVEAFAKPYPSLAIATVMGAPLEDAPRLHHWSNWIQRQFDAASMASEREEIEQAVEEFYEYAEALVRARRKDPGDDLISKLIEAEEQGDRLSDVECINLVFNVLVGGVDTSQSQLAHAIRLLAEHPEQWALLAEDPSLAERAVEEALRYEPITPFTARILTEEVSFRDVTFPEGTIVMVCAFTGNRDLDGDAGGGRPGALRHHRRARPRARADVRRGRALLPRREPRARGAAGGARVPGAAHAGAGARRRAGVRERLGHLRAGRAADQVLALSARPRRPSSWETRPPIPPPALAAPVTTPDVGRGGHEAPRSDMGLR